MKKRVCLTIVFVLLTSLVSTGRGAETARSAAPDDQPTTPIGSSATGPKSDTNVVIGMANPASVHCQEQGGERSAQFDAQGNEYSLCVFADGSVCEEWAFFRGECTPGSAASAPKLVFGWYGEVITPPTQRPFEYTLLLTPKESGSVELVATDPEAQKTLAYLRDSGQRAHVWGTLICEDGTGDPSAASCRVEATRIRPEGPGEIPVPDPIEGWRGTLESLPDGAQFDDRFVLADERFPVIYGIDARDPAVATEMEALENTGFPFLVFGHLNCGVIDVNGCQIVVDRVDSGEAETVIPASEEEYEPVVDWTGLIQSTPKGAQFDDYFEKMGYVSGEFGIDARSESLQRQIIALRDTGTQVHIWGRLVTDVPDVGRQQIVVARLQIERAREAPEVVTEEVSDWVGVVVSAPDMAQVDDYFQMMDQNGTRFGIWAEGELGSRLERLRDTGTVVHISGLVRYNVPDAYNAQITVTRLECE